MLPALALLVLARAPSTLARTPASLLPRAAPSSSSSFRPRYRSRGGGGGGGLPRARGGGPHPRVLVRVGGYVGDELLRREGEEAR